MKTKTFKKSELKREIKSRFGTLTNLKKHLKRIAKNEYGCDYAEIKVYGCKISYTSNPNCFASFLISVPLVGMTGQYGLGKSSITKAGKLRGCSSFYIAL